jgi:hypothetical protein
VRTRLNERLRAMNGDQRRLAVLLLILIIVATVFAGRSLLRSGRSSSSSSPATLPGQPAAAGLRERVSATKHAVTVAAKVKTKALVKAATATTTITVLQLSEEESFQVFETRDPFQPPESPTPPATTPPAAQPTTSPTASPPVVTPGTTTTTAAASFVPPTGQTVAVVDIFSDSNGQPRAHVRVGSTVYNVGVGATFAVSYKVVSLSQPCGQFLFGDSSFQLCEGQETIK